MAICSTQNLQKLKNFIQRLLTHGFCDFSSTCDKSIKLPFHWQCFLLITSFKSCTARFSTFDFFTLQTTTMAFHKSCDFIVVLSPSVFTTANGIFGMWYFSHMWQQPRGYSCFLLFLEGWGSDVRSATKTDGLLENRSNTPSVGGVIIGLSVWHFSVIKVLTLIKSSKAIKSVSLLLYSDI